MGRMALAQRLSSLADLALARQEDEDVALPQACQILDGVADRPVDVGTGAPSKCFEKRSASIVAEVTISLRSGRLGRSCLTYPRRKSMLRLRS